MNIIKLNLPVGNVVNGELVNCDYHQGAINNKYNIILKNLSDSLQYIKDKDTTQHKLFIQDSLSNWSKYLYESMQW